MRDNLEYQIEKVADSLKDIGGRIKQDGDFYRLTDRIRIGMDVLGEEIAPSIRNLEKLLKQLKEKENAKMANDAIIKLMEIKRSFDKNEISKDELLVFANAIIKNFSSANTSRESAESVDEIAKLISKTIKSKESKTEGYVSSCD